jgi:GntR family transcriptional regulator
VNGARFWQIGLLKVGNPIIATAQYQIETSNLSETAKIENPFQEDGTPYYVQLASILRRSIANGTWNIGDQLPTLKQLVSDYRVAPMTIRRALGVLQGEGLISLQRGRGTFVSSEPPATSMILRQLTNFLTPGGDPLVSTLVTLRPAKDELRIVPEEGSAIPPYQYLKRTYSAADQPYSIGDFLISDFIYEKLPEKRWRRELISPLLVETKEFPLSSIRQILTVNWATAEEAAQLGIRVHDSVVQVRRIFLNEKREVLCLGQLVYRADRVKFDINIDLDDPNRVRDLSGYPTK